MGGGIRPKIEFNTSSSPPKFVKYYVQFMSSTQKEFYFFLARNSWEWLNMEA